MLTWKAIQFNSIFNKISVEHWKSYQLFKRISADNACDTDTADTHVILYTLIPCDTSNLIDSIFRFCLELLIEAKTIK